MLTYSFENIGSESLYEYLYRCIKKDILEGKITAGAKLPSKRSFAKNHNVSTITIENTYGQLAAEGYIYSIPKKGYYVSDLTNRITAPIKITENSFKVAQDRSSYFVDFTSNQIAHKNFPFSTWKRLSRDILANREKELMTNSPSGGVLELRQAIAKHLLDFRGMKVSAEQIIVGAGTEYLYGLLILLLGHDKIYALEDPGYKKIGQIYNKNAVKSIYLQMDEEGIELKHLKESNANILHISPSHHFPTGKICSISRRYELLGWAASDEDRYIIEDDYDSEFRLIGNPIPTMQSIDNLGKVIYMNTFSKSLSSTIRISYMILPPVLLKKFYEELYFYSCTVSNFEQYTLAAFINEKYFEKHINRMRNYYIKLRDELIFAFKASPLSKKAYIKEENSGLHFLMQIDSKYTDEELLKRAVQNGIRISFLSQYYADNDATNHMLVMNYSSIEKDKLKEAFSRLNDCL